MVAIRILKVNGFSQEIVIFSGYMILLKFTYFSLYFNRLVEIWVLSVWKIRYNLGESVTQMPISRVHQATPWRLTNRRYQIPR